MKNNKNIIIGALVIVILLMAVGYSAFATQLTLNGTAEIVGEWDVKVANVEVQSFSDGCDPGTPEFTNTSITVDAKLVKPGDKITYEITIENAGTINATLGNVIFQEDMDGSPAINYVTTDISHILNAGEQTTFTLTVEYIASTTEVPSVKTRTITGIIEYEQE